MVRLFTWTIPTLLWISRNSTAFVVHPVPAQRRYQQEEQQQQRSRITTRTFENTLDGAPSRRAGHRLFSTTEKTKDQETKTEDEVVSTLLLPRRSRSIEESTSHQLEKGLEKIEMKKKDEAESPVDASSFPQKTDKDFVFVGNRIDMERDEALRLVSSEVSVWKQFRKESPGILGGLPLDLLLQRIWDTAEDVFVHLRRIPYEKGWTELSEQEEKSRKTIVVLGSGWAAHALMKVADCNKLRLVVVSPSNHFVFTPMLASAAVGTVEYRSMTEAVRVANPMIHDYLEGAATDINVKEKTVTVKMESLLQEEVEAPTLTLNYDHLVVAVGCRVDDRGVPGAEKALRLKSTDDARKLRTAVGECFEYASRPDVAGPEQATERSRRVTFLIVGGGPTGVELAGEILDFMKDVTRPKKGAYPKLADSVRVILAHGGPDLVPQFEPALRSEALKALEKQGVEVMLNTRVTEVGVRHAKLSTSVLDSATGKPTGERKDITLPLGLTVWCAGTAPVPFVEKLLKQLPPEARFRDGRVKVDRWFRPPMTKDSGELGSIFVLGDAAAYEEGDGDLLPSTAQVAGQEGAYIARVLDRNYDLTTTPPKLQPLGHTTQNNATDLGVFDDPAMNQWLQFRGLEMAPPFGFLNLGMLAYLGGGNALTQVEVGDFPLFAWAGSVGFVLWRSVYLVKQVATRNRILVTFDWVKSALFGRDTTRL